jgi:hypothetical protein
MIVVGLIVALILVVMWMRKDYFLVMAPSVYPYRPNRIFDLSQIGGRDYDSYLAGDRPTPAVPLQKPLVNDHPANENPVNENPMQPINQRPKNQPDTIKTYSPACRVLSAIVHGYTDKGIPFPIEAVSDLPTRGGNQNCVTSWEIFGSCEDEITDPNRPTTDDGQLVYMYPTTSRDPLIYKVCREVEDKTGCILNCHVFDDLLQ